MYHSLKTFFSTDAFSLYISIHQKDYRLTFIQFFLLCTASKINMEEKMGDFSNETIGYSITQPLLIFFISAER